MTVEQSFEFELSPRCRDSITWDDNHIGGFVKPTHAPLASHEEDIHRITTEDSKELVEFDFNAAMHNRAQTGICSNM